MADIPLPQELLNLLSKPVLQLIRHRKDNGTMISRRFVFNFGCFLAILTILYLRPPITSLSPFAKQNSFQSNFSALPKAAHHESDASLFISGTTKPSGYNYSRVLVMGKLMEDDTSWIEQELPSLPTAIYVVDNGSAPLRIPKNKGHEAMVYLTYIIDHYDRLPDTSLFFHPHKITWHNNILLNLDTAFTIQSLSDARVAREGYFNARCHHDPGCPDWLHLDRPEAEWDLIKKTEERFFTSELWQQLHPGASFPASISQPCCAQFAVSRDRIRSRSQGEYIRYRNWLLDTELPDEISGRIMEYTWQYIFAGVSEFCPPIHACYCDGYGVCFGGAQQLQDWLDILKERELSDTEISVLMENGQQADSEPIKYLRQKSDELNQELSTRKEAAFRRGDDPRNRAVEAGREWADGDGF